jgi:hypothetical protein
MAGGSSLEGVTMSEAAIRAYPPTQEPLFTDNDAPFQKQRTFGRKWTSRFGCLWEAFSINYQQWSPLAEREGRPNGRHVDAFLPLPKRKSAISFCVSERVSSKGGRFSPSQAT